MKHEKQIKTKVVYDYWKDLAIHFAAINGYIDGDNCSIQFKPSTKEHGAASYEVIVSPYNKIDDINVTWTII